MSGHGATSAGTGGESNAEGGAPLDTGGVAEAGAPGSGGSGGSGAEGGSTALGGSSARGGSTSSSGGMATGGSTATAGAGASSGGASDNGGLGGGSGVAGMAGGSAGASANGGVGGVDATGGLAGLGANGGMSGAASCVPTVPPTEICDGIDNDCQNGIDDHGVCPAGCFGAIYSGHRYLLCEGTGQMTFNRNDAHTACVNHGTDLGLTLDLVRINSADEDAFVLGLIAAHQITDAVWNAASDSPMAPVNSTEGTWVWGNSDNGVVFYRAGAPVSNRYNDWASGQPVDGGGPGPGMNKDCAVFDPASDWHWVSVSCDTKTTAFVCEEPSP
jgi:hypothetical protein